jgi:hypothetical protein
MGRGKCGPVRPLWLLLVGCCATSQHHISHAACVMSVYRRTYDGLGYKGNGRSVHSIMAGVHRVPCACWGEVGCAGCHWWRRGLIRYCRLSVCLACAACCNSRRAGPVSDLGWQVLVQQCSRGHAMMKCRGPLKCSSSFLSCVDTSSVVLTCWHLRACLPSWHVLVLRCYSVPGRSSGMY